MGVCLFFFVVVYLGVVLAITLPYWYELGNTSCEEIPAAGIGPKQVLKLWAEASLRALFLGAAYLADPLLRRLEKANESGGGDMPPVLLIHGLYHNATGWLYLRKELRKAGFNDVRTMVYSSRRTSIEAITKKLDDAVQDLERSRPDRKPILVGHSLGGLLIRNWLADEANQRRILGALTLGAPHSGSKMATLAFGALGQSLTPTNPFFSELKQKESPAAIPCVSFVCEADDMVLPLRNLVPVTPGWVMRITPYTTHTGLLVKKAVLRMTVWELEGMAKSAENNAAGEKKAE